jgi:hypothetical protein
MSGRNNGNAMTALVNLPRRQRGLTFAGTAAAQAVVVRIHRDTGGPTPALRALEQQYRRWHDGRGDDPATAGLRLRALDNHCPRDRFSCGDPLIDGWFRERALDRHQVGLCRVVTAHQGDAPEPVGFHALTLAGQPTGLLRQLRRDLGMELPGFPAVHLLHTAVQTSLQASGIGKILFADQFARSRVVAEIAGALAITLVARPRVQAFFASLGFRSYDAGGRMLLPMQSLMELGWASPADTNS